VHLKSVQVQGFKTFAKKTELLFEPGITAVVGPNGSGKSNLVDAIRWVLGERSARELRGTRMEEIVYSGGARRAASGMAEVRLVIDNGDGRLPVPFAEVEVIRRGYRSGESDYWMNGSRCRLRDIEELFASTGLTQQGYAVVAQDDVDHIVQTSAADRRALIEEAAGVRGLRSKRQEAIAKLKEAGVSILRLGDVAAELGPRVEELRRQAEAAREQRGITGQLEALRGSLLQGEWRQARQAVKKATARVETLRTAAAAAETDAQAFAVDYEAQREKLARAHDARLERERRMGALRLAATHAGAKVELLAERLAATRLGVSQAEAGLTEARLRLEGLEAEVVAAREDAAGVADPGDDSASGDVAAELPGAQKIADATEREEAAGAVAEALREAHQENVAQVHRLEERVSLLRRLAKDGDIPAPSAQRLVELLDIPGVREAAIASGVDPATIAKWAAEGTQEQTALAAAGAAAAAELDVARADAAAAEARSRGAREAAAAAAGDLDASRSAHVEELAERRALLGRAAAVRGRLERSTALVERQREEVSRCEGGLAAAREGVVALETETAGAEAEAVEARSALEAAPMEAEAVEVQALTRALLEMEKGHLDRQVVLAHQQEALANAATQLEADSAVLADLTERIGGSGEAPDDVEVDWEKTQRDINRLDRQLAQLGPDQRARYRRVRPRRRPARRHQRPARRPDPRPRGARAHRRRAGSGDRSTFRGRVWGRRLQLPGHLRLAFRGRQSDPQARRSRVRRPRRRDPGPAGGQADAQHQAAVGRRARPDGTGFHPGAQEGDPQPLLHFRRGRCAAGRRQHQAIHGAAGLDGGRQPVHPHHPQPRHHDRGPGALRRHARGFGRLARGLGPASRR